VSGVGKASAQKFILAVSNKIKKEVDVQKLASENKSTVDSQYSNVIDLLVDWGVKKADVIKCIKENKEKLSSMKTEEIIQFLLKELR
jgi:Holliday junction resolvasome RuvABC DNA-binding subunit